MNIDSISFGAIPISKEVIKKYNKQQKKFIDYPVNFVKIDAYNKEDLAAILQAAKKWERNDKAKFVRQISNSCQWMQGKPIDIYALTIQKRNFENLRSENIIGLAEMRQIPQNSEYTLLNYLQIRPNTINVNQKNKVNYKYAGSKILKSLKELYENIILTSEYDDNIKSFYRRNGFINDPLGSNIFVWHNDFLKRLVLRIRNFRKEHRI